MVTLKFFLLLLASSELVFGAAPGVLSRHWNPSITGSCNCMTVRKSSCVESKFEPTQTTSLLPTGSSGHTGTTASIVTTSPVQPGIVTPAPQQPGMVEDCTKFYLVRPGDTCYTIASKYNITLTDFMQWNSPGPACEGLYAYVYACVWATSSGPKPTPTKPSNGTVTTSPAEPGIVTPAPQQP
ncbi:hypothetical protein H101_07917, partial [Trichophyton interdigitale H6]